MASKKVSLVYISQNETESYARAGFFVVKNKMKSSVPVGSGMIIPARSVAAISTITSKLQEQLDADRVELLANPSNTKSKKNKFDEEAAETQTETIDDTPNEQTNEEISNIEQI